VPAAAVIPAPIAYGRVVAVETFVVEPLLEFFRGDLTVRKIECSKQAVA